MPSVYLASGTVLKDRYRIEKKIGQGGFGIIYEAFDLQLKNTIVVKEFYISRLMYRASDSGEMQTYSKESVRQSAERLMVRFLAEARCMAQLGKQPTIPHVYDYFEANHTAYIVMELLEGQTLRQYLLEHDKQLPLDLALYITGQVAEALSVLHQNGIIHRDIAPDNIFLCDKDEIQVKTLDFGGARLMDESDQTLSPVLKVGYSPVEQYDRSEVHLGPWTDVYALGATLYYMLTGVKPIESTIRKKNDELVSPHVLRPEIPESISNATMKAMAIDYKYRYQTVTAFMDALEGKTNTVSLEKEIRRQRILRSLAVALIFLLFAGGAFFLYRFYSNKKAASTLPAAELTIWICAEEGSGEEAAMREILRDFDEQYPQVMTFLVVFSPDTYMDALSEAAAKGTLPDLFESTGASDSILAQTCDLSSLLANEYVSACLFLDDYRAAYPDCKQFPLGIEIPMAYIITKGDPALYYTQNTFSSLEDLTSQGLAAAPAHRTLLEENFDLQSISSWTNDGFLNDLPLQYPVFLSSSMMLDDVSVHLLSYENVAIPYAAPEIRCHYVYEWSVGAQADAPAQKAAFRLLAWMTSESYQEVLMITECSDGPLPINRQCFFKKADVLEMPVLKEIFSGFKFGGWQHEK